MSTTTPKVVMFNMEIGETPSPDEDHVDHNKLEEMVKELSQSLTGTNIKRACTVFDFRSNGLILCSTSLRKKICYTQCL